MTNFDDDDLAPNELTTEHFQEILGRVLANPARRRLLKGGLGLVGLVTMPALVQSQGVALTSQFGPTALGFVSVPKSLADHVIVPEGYVIKVLHATGDPINGNVAPYTNMGLEADDWSQRIGDHHDGMELFYITADGKYSLTATNRAVLVVNHESSADAHFFHPNGQTSNGVTGKRFTQFGDWDVGARPGLEVLKEINHHGLSIVELDFNPNGEVIGYKQDSMLNRRVTPQTVAHVAAAPSDLAQVKQFMRTKFDPTGSTARGTLNNCGHGKTPWGTYLTCEENWATYFNIPTDQPPPSGKSAVANKRYGLPATALAPEARQARSQGWYTVTDLADDENRFSRWNLSANGIDPAADFRNEGNTFGYVVEVDPLEPKSQLIKRVSLGRMAHEGAVCSLPKQGQPLAFYMGCDARNEYIYKFVSQALWDPKDVGGGIAVGDKYLNDGKLYVAKFNDDGAGEWLELSIENPQILGYAAYPFVNQADIYVNTRLAGDAVGATRMDRPEWGAVNPQNGEVYFTLTNNNSRSRNVATVDAANPRAYQDLDGIKRSGNPNGHIIRFKEADSNPTAKKFAWDIFLFGAEEDMPADVNLSGLTAENSFSSPDGLCFTPSTGLLWIQTDDGAATDETNCMMLAAIPGTVSDGGMVQLTNRLGADQASQMTFVGARLGEDRLKRFLVGPKGCEVTGLTETEDGKTLLVNIQHPGEKTKAIGQASQFDFQSQWPSKAPEGQRYGVGDRPRSATIIIRRADGGKIGLS